MDGISNIASSIIVSHIDLSPRAPSLNSIALSTIYSRTPSANVSSILSILNSLIYCFTSAFFGSVSIALRASLSKGLRCVSTGSLPIISGIRPYDLRSCGAIYWSRLSLSTFSRIFEAPKPTICVLSRCAIFLSIPSNAPPHIKRMFFVSTGIIFCSGCFLPPCGGTLTIDPSSNFRSPC